MKGWEKLFGQNLIERQFLINISDSEVFFNTLINLMLKYNIYSPFCAMKIFRGKRCGMMSFAQEGITFNILYRCEYIDFSCELSNLLVKYGSPEYLAKSSKDNTTFPNGYPNYKKWKELLNSYNIKSHFMN
jgi:hypothetical protein